MRLMIALAALVLWGSAASADCFCRCQNGAMVPVCTSPFDAPPVCPMMACPFGPAPPAFGPPPPAFGPPPPVLVMPPAPPVCVPRQVFNPFTNQYEWQQVCQ